MDNDSSDSLEEYLSYDDIADHKEADDSKTVRIFLNGGGLKLAA